MKKILNKANILGAVVSGDGLRYKRRPDLLVGDVANGYNKGDLMDANAVAQLITDATQDHDDDVDSLRNTLTDYIDQKVEAVIGGAPEVLDTLKEISEALNDDPELIKTTSSIVSDIPNNYLNKNTYDEQYVKGNVVFTPSGSKNNIPYIQTAGNNGVIGGFSNAESYFSLTPVTSLDTSGYFAYHNRGNGSPLLTIIGKDMPTSDNTGSTKYYSTELYAYGLRISNNLNKNENNQIIGNRSNSALLQNDGLVLNGGQIQLRLFNGNDAGYVIGAGQSNDVDRAARLIPALDLEGSYFCPEALVIGSGSNPRIHAGGNSLYSTYSSNNTSYGSTIINGGNNINQVESTINGIKFNGSGKNVTVPNDGYFKINNKDANYLLTSGGTIAKSDLINEAVGDLTQTIEDNEEVTAAALNDLNDRVSSIEEPIRGKKLMYFGSVFNSDTEFIENEVFGGLTPLDVNIADDQFIAYCRKNANVVSMILTSINGYMLLMFMEDGSAFDLLTGGAVDIFYNDQFNKYELDFV